MKFLEKLALILFSIMISVLSIVCILVALGLIEIRTVVSMMGFLLYDVRITLSVAFVALLLAIKCIFFSSKPQDDGRNGVTLENNSGKLVISKESLETLIANVVKDVQGIEAISSRTILDRDNNVIVYVTTLVSKDMMIKDVSTQIQDKIKDALSKTADLQVKQVNIKVKNITNKKIKGLPAAEETESTNENEAEVEE